MTRHWASCRPRRRRRRRPSCRASRFRRHRQRRRWSREGGGSLTYLKPVTARSLLAGEVEVEVTGRKPSGKSLGSAWSRRRRHTKVIKSKKAQKPNKFPGAKNHAAFCSKMSADPPRSCSIKQMTGKINLHLCMHAANNHFILC